MELPNRKPNRIEEYDYSQSGAYFVTICTQDRKRILSAIVGDGFPVPKFSGEIAEQFIQKIPEKYPNITVDKYVIMPDHIHLLFRFDSVGDGFPVPCGDGIVTKCGRRNASPTVGAVVGWYKYQVTKQVNLLSDTPGQKLFQRSYYDHVIRNQQDYNEIWEYIENNPRKWVITKEGRD